MSERVFYPDTDDVSSTSKVVALSIARNRARELILSASTIQFAPGRIRRGGRFNESHSE
jgi:hypothetical protein